jgi:predicted transposase YbfD/YdcC
MRTRLSGGVAGADPGTPGSPLCRSRGVLDHFSELKDPRGVGRCEYPLETVLLIAMLGVLCGAEGWTDLALFAASKHAWLCTFLTLPIQPPREGVFRRVFSAIRPSTFEACMRSWVQSLALPLDGQVIAFDGKALRGAIARAFGRTALHQVHAWAGAQGLVLAQTAVKGAPEEGEAIRALLAALDLEDAIVTMDAEVRQVWAVPASQLGERAGSWPGLRSSVRIDRTRVLGDGTVEQRTHGDGSSLPPRVRRLAEEIREHRDIENGLHWDDRRGGDAGPRPCVGAPSRFGRRVATGEGAQGAVVGILAAVLQGARVRVADRIRGVQRAAQ